MALEKAVLEKAKYWANSEVFDQKTRDEINRLITAENTAELTDRFYRDLEFGTGGMRGILGAGTARMNEYNIRKATAALCQHILKENPAGRQPSLAISYDSRNFSIEFAKITAAVAAAHGVKAYITKELRPVPMLSYLVREWKCSAGVCITASHNPPNYNGYKVYWNTGAQIIPPHDTAVISNYGAIQAYEDIPMKSYEEAIASGLIEEVHEELDTKYYNRIEQLSLKKDGRDNFKIAFTPLHGTAGKPALEVFKRFGFKDVHIVAEQAKPDGNFPTVKSPNPEDPDALKMAYELGQKVNADIILGTDPDCDRVGIIYRDGTELKYLNGNQIGCLLTEYVLEAMQDEKKLPENPLVIKTIVTTELQRQIGEHYGAHVDDTLTGFKWICGLIEDYESGKKTPYRKYVCGGEESYGFLMDSFVRDKDGLIACAIAAEMVAYYKSQGLNLTQKLRAIYRRHGVYQESLHTVTMPGREGAEKITAIMDRLRKDPPTVIDGVPVSSIKDIASDTVYKVSAHGPVKSGKVGLPSSNVLQFFLEDGTKVSCRPSGTEPKIKYYVSVREAIDSKISEADLDAAITRCKTRVNKIENIFVELSQ